MKLLKDNTTIKCEFGCGQLAKYHYDYGKYCCAKKPTGCPTIQELLTKKYQESERYKNSKVGKANEKLKKGELKCKYCGKKANYIFISYGQYYGRCQKKSADCPMYTKIIGKKLKKKYKDNPKLLEFQRKFVKEMSHRPEVIEKKQEAMLRLHRGDCKPCKEFQKNYRLSRENEKKRTWNKWFTKCIELGEDIENLKNKTTVQLYNIYHSLKNRLKGD